MIDIARPHGHAAVVRHVRTDRGPRDLSHTDMSWVTGIAAGFR